MEEETKDTTRGITIKDVVYVTKDEFAIMVRGLLFWFKRDDL